jgi:hypothetical protein
MICVDRALGVWNRKHEILQFLMWHVSDLSSFTGLAINLKET